MRNASCFVILFLVNNQLHFLKEASKLNPLLVQQNLPLILSIKYPTPHMNTHKTINSRAPKSDPKSGVRLVLPVNHCIPPTTSSFSGHYFHNSSFWVHTRFSLLLVQCTNTMFTVFSITHTICKGPKPDAQRSQRVTPANCQYAPTCQHN